VVQQMALFVSANAKEHKNGALYCLIKHLLLGKWLPSATCDKNKQLHVLVVCCLTTLTIAVIVQHLIAERPRAMVE
jgi:hypothetical protein